MPGFFVGCSAAITLYIASRALSSRCPLPQVAGLCAMAVVLVPDTREVLLNIVNIQWPLAAGLVLLLLSRDPAGAGQWTHDLLAAVALGLTGPFGVFLLPLFLLRALRCRTLASTVLTSVLAACACVQVHFMRGELAGGASGLESWGLWGQYLEAMVGCRIGGSLLLGTLLPAHAPAAVWALLAAVTLGGMGYLAFRPGALRDERAALGLAFVVFVAAASVRTFSGMNMFYSPQAHSRYLYVPQLLMILLLLVAAAQGGRVAPVVGLVVAWCLLVNLPRLREPAYADMQWSLFAPRIRAGEVVTVPINPPGWTIQVQRR